MSSPTLYNAEFKACWADCSTTCFNSLLTVSTAPAFKALVRVSAFFLSSPATPPLVCLKNS